MIFGVYFGRNDCYKISEKEYKLLIDVQCSLLKVLEIEEKYNIIIENYKEFELSLMEISLENALHYDPKWTSFRNEIRKTDRKANSLLSSCTIYTKYITEDIGKLGKKFDCLVEKISKVIKRIYSNSFEYRFMEELRNHVQHCGFSITNFTFERGWESYASEEKLRQEPFFYVNTKKISEIDKKIASKFEEEFKDLPDNKIDLKIYIRKYIESLSELNDYIRNELEHNIKEWIDILHEFKSKHKRKTNSNLPYITIFKKNKGIMEEKNLFFDYIKARKKLVNKNKKLANLQKYLIIG